MVWLEARNRGLSGNRGICGSGNGILELPASCTLAGLLAEMERCLRLGAGKARREYRALGVSVSKAESCASRNSKSSLCSAGVTVMKSSMAGEGTAGGAAPGGMLMCGRAI